MKLSNLELSSALEGAGFSRDTFNSNNGWGFGGAVGDRFTSPDSRVVVKIATAYFRHLPSAGFVTVTVEGRRLYDEARTASADHSRALALALGTQATRKTGELKP